MWEMLLQVSRDALLRNSAQRLMLVKSLVALRVLLIYGVVYNIDSNVLSVSQRLLHYGGSLAMDRREEVFCIEREHAGSLRMLEFFQSLLTRALIKRSWL
jgi:hypothetical protein